MHDSIRPQRCVFLFEAFRAVKLLLQIAANLKCSYSKGSTFLYTLHIQSTLKYIVPIGSQCAHNKGVPADINIAHTFNKKNSIQTLVYVIHAEQCQIFNYYIIYFNTANTAAQTIHTQRANFSKFTFKCRFE